MEEKKLTDEEIVKDIERSTGMPSYWKKIVLDLIYRLQDEKQKVVQDYYCEAQHCDVQKDIIEKQKAEIEKLKSELRKECEEHEAFTKKAKAEIERLTEERDVYLDDCSAVRHKLRQEIEEKFELQKQVDELTAFKNEAISMSLYGKGRKDGEEVAVKDTAKEILDMLYTAMPKTNIVVEIKKRYGVEVE